MKSFPFPRGCLERLMRDYSMLDAIAFRWKSHTVPLRNHLYQLMRATDEQNTEEHLMGADDTRHFSEEDVL